jgi:Fur family transcriptional regulator, ferric uptake regulator
VIPKRMKGHSHSHQHHHGSERANLPELTDKLRQQSRRITGPRQAILNVLRHHPHPMTNKEIHAALAKGDSDLATIYRSMHLLESMGMVQRFDFGDGVARYELVEEGDDGHHHHLICTQCSEVVEIEECFPPDLEQKIAQGNGFKSITHKLEFFGICPGCQKS